MYDWGYLGGYGKGRRIFRSTPLTFRSRASKHSGFRDAARGSGSKFTRHKNNIWGQRVKSTFEGASSGSRGPPRKTTWKRNLGAFKLTLPTKLTRDFFSSLGGARTRKLGSTIAARQAPLFKRKDLAGSKQRCRVVVVVRSWSEVVCVCVFGLKKCSRFGIGPVAISTVR